MAYRPDDTLVLAHDRPEALVDEPLQPLSFIGFSCIDVALRIGRDAVHAKELAGLTPTVAEAGQELERYTPKLIRRAAVPAVSQ